jgi:hypothetical protein
VRLFSLKQDPPVQAGAIALFRGARDATLK